MTDEQLEILVTRAQKGDRQAVEILLSAHKQSVFALALSFLRERESAEEAAQEAFIRIFQRLGGLKKPRKFRTWCLTITANHCRDRLRAKGLKTVPLESAPEPRSAEQSEELSENLTAGLNSLNPSLRQALLLREVENFSYQEISEIQKAALGTVKSRIFEARRKLKKWMTSCSVTR